MSDPQPGATPEEAAKWNAATAEQRKANNPLTVRHVTGDPTTGTVTATFHQVGKNRDPIWTTTKAPAKPQWSLKGAIKDAIKSRITPKP